MIHVDLMLSQSFIVHRFFFFLRESEIKIHVHSIYVSPTVTRLPCFVPVTGFRGLLPSIAVSSLKNEFRVHNRDQI